MIHFPTTKKCARIIYFVCKIELTQFTLVCTFPHICVLIYSRLVVYIGRNVLFRTPFTVIMVRKFVNVATFSFLSIFFRSFIISNRIYTWSTSQTIMFISICTFDIIYCIYISDNLNLITICLRLNFFVSKCRRYVCRSFLCEFHLIIK